LTINDIPDFQIDKKIPIWVNVEDKTREEPYSNWNMTTLSRDSCKIPKNHKLPKTDSRLRPDRIALEKLQQTEAASEKHRLEEAQRHKKKFETKIIWNGHLSILSKIRKQQQNSIVGNLKIIIGKIHL